MNFFILQSGPCNFDKNGSVLGDPKRPDATCRACGVEPYAYLLHVLTELPQRAQDADVTDLLWFRYAEQMKARTPSS